MSMEGEGKICSVCGDQALGYNFNAVTCESCKAFFRRNALKTRELRCPFKQCCDITAVTRRFCQKCRLEKCYRVGMKRELIMSDAEKEKKRRKILANKARLASVKSSEDTSNEKSVQVKIQGVEIATQTEPMSCFCQYSANARSSSPLMAPSPPPDTAQIGSALSINPHKVLSPLRPQEILLLEDLVSASKALDAPVDEEINNLPGEEFKSCSSKSLLDVINLTAIAIRRLIKMCMRISGFRSLCDEDRMTLLKQGCTHMMLLRSVMSFDPDKNSWTIPHSSNELSQINMEVLKEARGNLYNAHKSFLRSFDPRASRDLNIMCILTAIALFDPNRSNLVNKNDIQKFQETYFNLLQSYLQSKYSYEESNQIYQHLIWKMTELHHLNEEHLRVYLNVNPSQVEPILIEIFDLKTR